MRTRLFRWIVRLALISGAASFSLACGGGDSTAPEPASETTEVSSSEEGATHRIVWNVTEGEFPTDVEEEFKTAIEQNAVLVSGAQAQSKLDRDLSIETLTVDGEWASLDAAPRNRKTGEFVGTEGLPFLARRQNDHWEIVFPSDARFLEWLPLVPETLLSPEVKSFLLMRYGAAE